MNMFLALLSANSMTFQRHLKRVSKQECKSRPEPIIGWKKTLVPKLLIIAAQKRRKL